MDKSFFDKHKREGLPKGPHQVDNYMEDIKSTMGYRDDSPFRNEEYLDINTPNGIIDMSNTGIPLLANGRLLQPYSGQHQFDSNVVREVPLAQTGGEFIEKEMDDAEIEAWRARGYIIEEIDSNDIPLAQTGGTVSELYEQKTGQPWATAKENGLTDGSYAQNVALMKKLSLVEPEPQQATSLTVEPSAPVQKAATKTYTPDEIASAPDFNTAFSKARDTYGKNNTFEYEGNIFTTNRASEPFIPTDNTLINNDIDLGDVIEQNKQVASPYTTKETVKLTKPEYQDIDELRDRKLELNKMNNADKINAYYKDHKEEGKVNQYIIVDKKAGRYHLYRDGVLQKSFEGVMGENESDEQTQTVKGADGKTDWSKGNKSTGMGEYTISNKTESHEHYYGAPSFNMTNSRGIEVPTSFHATPYSRRKTFDNEDMTNRMSNGCINGKCADLKDLYSKYNLTEGDKVYILPEEDGNTVTVNTDGIKFKASAANRGSYNPKIGVNVSTSKYWNRDSVKSYQQSLYDKGYLTGDIEKQVDGQWGKNTQAAYDQAKADGFDPVLQEYQNNIKPIKMFINKDGFEKDIYNEEGGLGSSFLNMAEENTFTGPYVNNTTDDEEYNNVTKPYMTSLADNKAKIMKETGISNDEYNDIAKVAFGILGVESHFGDTHSGTGNAIRTGFKLLDESSSSPDTEFKASLTTDSNRSTGLTQIRWDSVVGHPNVMEQLNDIGIYKREDFSWEKVQANPALAKKLNTIGIDTPKKMNDQWNRVNGDPKSTAQLASFGITDNTDFNDPEVASIATMIMLINKYNNEVIKEKPLTKVPTKAPSRLPTTPTALPKPETSSWQKIQANPALINNLSALGVKDEATWNKIKDTPRVKEQLIAFGIVDAPAETPDNSSYIMNQLPSKWNKNPNYTDRVKEMSKYLTIKQKT